MVNIECIENNIVDIENRIQELKQIKKESNSTVSHLNGIIAEHISARDNEIKKEKQQQKNIDRLKVKLDKLKELKPSKIQ